MWGFFAGLYLSGGIHYYKKMEPYEVAEKAAIVGWPVLAVIEGAFRLLDYASRKALEKANREDDRRYQESHKPQS